MTAPADLDLDLDLDQLRSWDRAHVWHPFTALADWEASDPLVIERGEGVYLFDTAGNRYLDGVSSLWCNVHGHRHPRLDAALLDQVGKMAHSTLLGVDAPDGDRAGPANSSRSRPRG